MLFCVVINVTIERIGYKPLRNQPRLAPLITAIGFSFILQGIGLAWKGPGRVPIPDVLPHGQRVQDRRCRLLLAGVHRAPDHRAGADRAHLPREEHEAGQGDARDRPGPGRLGDDGHQRRPHDLVHASRSAARSPAPAASSTRCTSAPTNFQLGFRLGLFAFTAAVLGGIGNLTGAVLGGLILGLIAAYNDGFGDARWTTTIVFSILILILVFRPSGLLGEQTPGGQ